MDPWGIFCETFYKKIIEVDPIFEQVDISDLISELRAIHLEVFGVAWFHHVGGKFTLIQSEFTKHYLEEHGFADTWEIMLNYNKATARSATGGLDPKSRVGRAQITFVNLTRSDSFDKWLELGYEPEAAARVANRIGSKKAWKSNKVNIYLSYVLTDQLECEVNDEARHGILAIIQGFYAGALEAIKGVKIIE